MATILLSAAGAAIGSSFGGTVLGLSATAAGRFVGATIGRSIDQRLLGQGSDPVEQGRVERVRLTGAGEGAAIPRLWGRFRVGGHIIWASRFTEHVRESGGGKGAPSTPATRSFSYSVSLAVALCEGEITHVPRVWADGAEVAPEDLGMRVYTGAPDQMPDPKIEAVEGEDQAPAYRGTAYVVFEDLNLEPFGNRIPQFSFEVCRPVQPDAPGAEHEVARGVRGVALIPGTGEYALATDPVYLDRGPGDTDVANVNSPAGLTDFEASFRDLNAELPNCEAVSLVVSWFGDDLRCGTCGLRPRVEQQEADSDMPWRVSGLTRDEAGRVPLEEGRPVYGGTPTDASVVQAIRHMGAAGKAVMFYPFILMEQLADNGLPDPWSGADDQPPLPWRGRITLSEAPGRDGSPDGTAAAEAQVAAFMGTARAADFTVSDGEVGYSGPAEWSYSRFILHYAALCAAAGGVEAFCVGSEMRGLTQIRGPGGSFPAVAALRDLLGEVRALLGPEVKLGYAADWSEYFGYQPPDAPGDLLYHLDPLWADPRLDFIGIDNYMPLSDWREGVEHLDAVEWESIHDHGYLKANIEGGEGYDWYYRSDAARAAQIRTPITDGEGEPWIWRVKDIRNWWSHAHHDRVGGLRQAQPTVWEPRSKPIWFTEYGCPAVDKGTNQPNKFVDPKSSESALPYFSDGERDELIQAEYLRAIHAYWAEPGVNPVSEVYEGPMIDMSRAFVWCWDARPYPWFPANAAQWSDGDNYRLGHWISGRASGQRLATVAAEICRDAGLEDFDTDHLHGFVRGYEVSDPGEGRAALQPLMLAHGFDPVEREGEVRFVMRDGLRPAAVDPARLAVASELEGRLMRHRVSEAELAGRVRLRFVEADGDYTPQAEEAVLPDEATHAVSTTDLAMALTRAEARALAERWLAEARVARETARLALPPSRLALGPGVVLSLDGDTARYRIDRVEQGAEQVLDLVRIDPGVYSAPRSEESRTRLPAFAAPRPVLPLFLDLPLMKGDEVPHAPHLAVTAARWPGIVAAHASAENADYALDILLAGRATVGLTETVLEAAPAGRVDRGPGLQVRLVAGQFEAVSEARLMAGANLLAVGDGSPGHWELLQFRDAQALGEGRWLLSHLLRGRFGSDGLMPVAWPAGSYAVLMDAAPEQIGLALRDRRVARHYRIGPAARPVDDPSYRHVVAAFDGNGLRPYRPCHLRAAPDGAGGQQLSWIRQSRIGGEDWAAPEVPLGEEQERYLLRIFDGNTQRREALLAQPAFAYGAALRAADGITGRYRVEVAQVSALYGAGPAARLDVVP
ncbi:host specificity protein [Aquicoccus sp. SCR17]|nr:host specificity protein [Carideicomes alvinocaridis]